MRLSVDPTDPGYGATQNVSVTVDGVTVTSRCYTADEELGKAWCFKHNDKDRPYFDPDIPSCLLTEVLKGKVVITLGA